MFRYADDYLIVLDNKDKALDVVDQLQHPRNPYGLHFRPEKTQVFIERVEYFHYSYHSMEGTIRSSAI